SGRTVYGGGGIMPDIFVPMDTTGNSEYFNNIYRKGLIYRFAYAYSDDHREKLSEFTEAAEFDNYLRGQNILNEFVEYAEEKGIERSAEGIKASGNVIETQLKAYIARNIIGEEGFYPIISHIDNTLQEAIDITRKDLLAKNLSK
ncbi:MAG: peptidase S41, partial [Tangfeifania sp.]